MPADLHQQITDEIAHFDGPVDRALRAVVERHQPVPCAWGACRSPETHRVCATCGPAVNHPCDELRTIAEQLGIQEAS
ncbi:hypothetical protein Drose_04355 [Dactylosporangium roseum]|uniref:Uncharacterized protein n=1 Tax=Dactylosporangium roseum TaxID=47989 RepID=A0ABY5Z7R4_9ACTN|nr:hypothetical protein [Dactylosporangium roseum]UWZ37522.1 hypothetical protein Drose_04355 [Dactylosporangium roseum]